MRNSLIDKFEIMQKGVRGLYEWHEELVPLKGGGEGAMMTCCFVYHCQMLIGTKKPKVNPEPGTIYMWDPERQKQTFRERTVEQFSHEIYGDLKPMIAELRTRVFMELDPGNQEYYTQAFEEIFRFIDMKR